jgi:curli biogenesis system outer membrane secretion channel CsgG
LLAATDLKPAIDRLSVKTVAFWKLLNHDKIPLDPIRFADKLEIELLKNGNCAVVDRSNLQRITVEMKLATQGTLSSESIKQIGKLYGVGGFIYADTFNDFSAGKMKNQVLIVKLVNTETGELLFAKAYRLDGTDFETSYDIALKVIRDKFQDSIADLKARSIRRIAVWDVHNEENSQVYAEKLTCAMTETGMQVVDRENLEQLVKEQKFTSSELVDPKTAIALGQLYGIDGFLYGNLAHSEGAVKGVDRYYSSDLALKMIDTEKGILVWGEDSRGTCLAYDVGRAEERKKVRRQWAVITGDGALIFAGATLVPLVYPEYFSTDSSRRTWMWSTASASVACFITWLTLK